MVRTPSPTDRQPTARAAAAAAARDMAIRRCRAYLRIAPGGIQFSHVTAAVVYGMPLPPALEARREIDVSVSCAAQPPRRRGVIGHRQTRVREPLHREGIPLMPVDLVWAQLANMLGHDDLVIAGDFVVRRKRAASTLERLSRAAEGLRGGRGAVAARAALRDIRSGTDSPMETRMRLVLLRGGLPEPVIGHTVYDSDGFFVGTPDLAYIAEKIAIEYEGDDHRTSRQTFRDDIERREQFEQAGWRVVRVTADHLARPQFLVARVSRILRERGPATMSQQ
jgi:hypothetical protein